MSKYKVTCINCKITDEIVIHPNGMVEYKDNLLMSARRRPDMKWGFECICGNDSRICKEEEGQISKIVKGSQDAIRALAESLKIKDEDKFLLEEIR